MQRDNIGLPITASKMLNSLLVSYTVDQLLQSSYSNKIAINLYIMLFNAHFEVKVTIGNRTRGALGACAPTKFINAHIGV